MTKFPIVTVETCPLCGSSGPLRESHIIPRFVFDWLLESSASGYMRAGDAPNLRAQDGLKQRLLCDPCESRLSVWENETAQHLFRPYHHDTSTVVTYGPWLARFCASVCWRALFIHRSLGLELFSTGQLTLADGALRAWSDLIFDRTAHPGEFELHLLPVDVIATAEGSKLPPNMNRYLARAVEIDVVRNDESAFVYAKMCKLIVLGFIQMPKSRQWHGTRVAMKQGTVAPGQRGVPGAFGEYRTDRARRLARLQAAISKRQQDKIRGTIRADLDRAAKSESFGAMSHDVRMFGDAAFDEPEEES